MRQIFILFFFILLIGQASAGSYSINGTTYDTTWDGRVIPSDQIVYGSNDDVILVQPFIPATAFTVGNDTIWINNTYTTFNREKFKISPVLTYSKALLLSKMVSVNASVGYLTFPYSLSRVKDFVSENELRIGNWTFRTGAEHIDVYDDNETQNTLNKSSYTFKIVNDEIRLYFLKSEANKLQGNIIFEMNSWTINGSTTPAWQNTTLNNVTEDKGDHCVKIWNYSDNFNDNNHDYYLDSDITLTVSNGSANITAAATGYHFAYTNKTMPITFNYSLDFKTTSNTVPIFQFRRQGTSAYYFLQFYLGDWKIYRYTGAFTQIGNTYTWTFPASTWNHIEIYSNGSYMAAYINGNWRINGTDSTYPNGSIGFGQWSAGYLMLIDNITVLGTTTSGNLTSWYDSDTGNEVYQIDVNATTPPNTNYTVNAYNNVTGAFLETLGTALTGNQSLTVTNKVQDYKINVTLNGNQTATPELIQITFWTQTVSGGELSCGLNTLTNVTVFANGSAINCNPTNGTAAITMSYKFQQNASNDYYVFNMTTATSSSRIFNESSNNASLGIQILQGGLGNNLNHTVKIYNATNQTIQFWIKSNSTGWLEYNTSKFSTPRYTVITAENPGVPIIIYGGLAVVIISGLAYILRRVTKI